VIYASVFFKHTAASAFISGANLLLLFFVFMSCCCFSAILDRKFSELCVAIDDVTGSPFFSSEIVTKPFVASIKWDEKQFDVDFHCEDRTSEGIDHVETNQEGKYATLF